MYLNLSTTIHLTRRHLIPFQRFKFPGGEEHIKIQEVPLQNKIKIVADMKSSSDVMTTLLATDALRGIYGPSVGIDLITPYLPYARQDRRMVPGEPLSIKVMANILNAQRYAKVTVFDPHSDVGTALVDNVEVVNNHRLVATAIGLIMERNMIAQTSPIGPEIQVTNFNDKMRLISPDAGAEKKVFKLSSFLNLKTEHVLYASKRRSVETGQILETKLEADVTDKICIIVDDIIDGGRTFTELAALLKQKGAAKVYLIISHGIFSAGLDGLKKDIDAIYISDSIHRINDGFVSTIALERVMDI